MSANLEFQRKFVYDNDKSLSSFKRQTLIAETQTDLASIVDLAGIYCEPDKRFGEYFDGVYELNYTKPNVTNIELLREDYCERANMVEKKLFDVNSYKNITINPENIDTNFNCEPYWRETLPDYTIEVSAFPDNSRLFKHCVKKNIKSSHYAEHVINIWMLNEIRITEEQRLAERSKTIAFLKKLYDDVGKCQEEEEKEDEEEKEEAAPKSV